MPTISTYFHACCQDSKGVFDILTCQMTEGDLLRRQLRLVEAWAELHNDELLADWELAQNGELPFKIDPFR